MPAQCTFYLQGKCTKGAQCRFEHGGATSRALTTQAKPKELVVESSVKGRKETLRVSRHRRRLLFSCAIDVSGSMSGAPIRAAMETLGDLFHSVMSDGDQFAACTFSSEVKKLHAAMPKSRVDFDRDLGYISDNRGGRTALWDGVAWAITAASMEYSNLRNRFGTQLEVPVIEILILTDGHDNCSKRRFSEIHEMTQRPGVPNFNLVVVGLGDVDTAALSKLCEPKNCHFHHARDVPQFKETLAHVVEQIRLRLDVDAPTGRAHFEWSGRKADAPTQLRGLARSGMWETGRVADDAGRLEDIMRQLRLT